VPRWIHPSRRFLLLPAWIWLLVPLIMVVAVHWIGPPLKLSEPPARMEIVHTDLILLTPDGESYRFVRFEDQKGVKPLWSVSTEVREQSQVTWSTAFGESADGRPWQWLNPGLYIRTSQWSYKLFIHRFDETGMKPFLPADEVERLRPLIVAELNRRFPDERRGDRLERLLTQGVSEGNSYCIPNMAIILAWLFGLLAVAAVCSMFVRPRQWASADATRA
jgi:hypothetical protein